MTDAVPSWVAYAQLAVPLVAAATAIPAYLFNARIRRRESLLSKRREVFSNYVNVIQLNISGTRDNRRYQSAYADIFVYGTDDVIRAVADFHRCIADQAGKIDGKRAATAYARMIKAMRDDCFSSSELSYTDLLELVPFNY